MNLSFKVMSKNCFHSLQGAEVGLFLSSDPSFKIPLTEITKHPEVDQRLAEQQVM